MAHIRKVTDLRTGLVHPTRGCDGKFISRNDAAWVLYTIASHPILSHIAYKVERGVYKRA